ncbi:hypothetical protein ABZV31_14265 [Streptomyces sp. NPDC005202]
MDARRARSLHEGRLMSLPNVTGVGTGKDERTNVRALLRVEIAERLA